MGGSRCCWGGGARWHTGMELGGKGGAQGAAPTWSVVMQHPQTAPHPKSLHPRAPPPSPM